MAGRASYRRSRERADQVSDFLGVTPEYNAKFDYLMHQTPFFGWFSNGVDAIRDVNYYVDKRVGGWDKVKRNNVLSSTFNTGYYAGINFVSKNLEFLYF